jgi:UDP-N-acetylglucosamine--N-acetylmuramyl-(pentapeptide) pyrophosphoryl-undecaprenol N-acetylglucosamine transferase
MKVLLSGGGTGGHVYPALAAAAALPERAGGVPVEFIFAGPSRNDVGGLVRRAGIPFAPLPAAGIRGRSPAQVSSAGWQLLRGTARAWRMVGRFKPDVALATGGYASVPVAVAARLRGVPLVLYLPDVHPGWAARFEARLARRIAVTNDGAARHLPRGKAIVTGYPVRAEFFAQDRAQARCALALGDGLPLLLVTGATQGAQALNRAVWQSLPSLLSRCAVLHQTGPNGLEEAHGVAASLPDEQRTRYRVVAYLDDMPAAMAAADLVLMRAGASSLAEPPAAALPAILVPGLFGGGHQRHNAEYMAGQGAALLLSEEQLGDLSQIVLDLLAQPDRLAAMRAATAALARPHAAQALADVLLEAAG